MGKLAAPPLPVDGFLFRPITAADVAHLFTWHYPPPYDLYNPGAGGSLTGLQAAFLQPDYRYHAVFPAGAPDGGELIAYRCFGVDARVPGGHYDDDRLDMGGGMRPDLTGRGWGPLLMRAAMRFAHDSFGATRFRATVAAFNERALKACQKAGYRMAASFDHPAAGRRFIILVADWEPAPGSAAGSDEPGV